MEKRGVPFDNPQENVPDEPPPNYEAAIANPEPVKGVASARNIDTSVGQTLGSATAPPSQVLHPLTLPCVIPQVSKNFRGPFFSPFVRAYAPALEAHGLAKSDMVTFIDGLNEAFVANPVMQTTGVLGGVLTMFYGLQPVQLAGVGLQVASGLASFATSYGRTKAYVKAVNVDLFNPIGLHCNIMSTKKMMQKVGLEGTRLQLPAAASSLRDMPLQPRPRGNSSSSSGSDSSIDNDTSHTTVEEMQKRRIKALHGHVQPLSFDVPPAGSPDSFFRRMGASQAKRMQRKQEKKLTKSLRKHDRSLIKRQRGTDKKVTEVEKKMAEEHAKMEHDLGKKKAQKEPKEAEKIKRDYEKEHAKLQRELEKERAKFERKMDKRGRKAETRPPKHDRKEEKVINKTRWIVISQRDENTARKDEEEEEDDDSDLECEHDAPKDDGTDPK